MEVETSDKLLIEMSVNGMIWNQTITNRSHGESVDFDMDMEGHAQAWALFQIELPRRRAPPRTSSSPVR